MISLKVPAKSEREALMKFFRIIPSVLSSEGLTDKETEVLVELLMLKDNKYKYNRFSRHAKKKVIENMMKYHNRALAPVGLNGTIYAIAKKGFIWKDTDGVFYVQKLLEVLADKLLNGDGTVMLKFEIEDGGTDEQGDVQGDS